MKLLLVGTGYMALEYAKVLSDLRIDFEVIGRSEANCTKFMAQYPNIMCSSGGLEHFQFDGNYYTHAIIASNVESLYYNTIFLLKKGVKKILLEKPGGKNSEEVSNLAQLASQEQANILLAYNRRFYASTLKAKELIREDGGVTSFNFEFTEWSHTIRPLNIPQEVKNNWFLANSSHVIDTAFFIGGKPRELSAYCSGSLDWHPKSSNYVGAGVTTEGVLFAYHANWEAPGRWVLEFLTKKRRFIFKPMETLQVQMLGSVAVNPVELDDELDKVFKPGIFLQTKAFIDGEYSRFCNIGEQKNMVEAVYIKMSGYQFASNKH